EFTDELIPFISAPEYDCFRFTVELNSQDFTKDVVENISPTKKPQVLIVLPTHPTLQLNLKFQPSSESLFAYVVWIFLSFLVYSVVPPYLLSLRTEYIIFDPGICKSTFSTPDISHRCRTVKKFNTHRSHLNTYPMLIHGQNNPLLDVLLFHFYPSSFTQEPDNSLSMGDEHLDTIPATESDEFRKYGVETLIQIPSESKGIPEHMCDVPIHDNSPPLDVSKDQIEDFSESNKEFFSIDDDSFSIDTIDYVEASPPILSLSAQRLWRLLSRRDFTKDVVEDISPTKEPQVLITLPTYPSLQLNMKFQPSSESLFTYVV
nr:hypothetical protein [Tanacetum cinerariifolium]